MISIITVVFNGGSTIQRTIESVCNQTMLPLEYLIIDGGSTDNTIQIVKEYQEKYSFIKFFSEKDKGVYDGMNKGIRLAKGKIIGMINSDDWYEKNTIEIIHNEYNSKGSGIYYGMIRYIRNDQELRIERNSHLFPEIGMIPHPSTFISKDIYNSNGTYSLTYKYSADLELIMKLIAQKMPFYPVDNILANFTIGGLSSLPEAEIESLNIRKSFNYLSNKQFLLKLLKVKVKKIIR